RVSATTHTPPLSLHDALPISKQPFPCFRDFRGARRHRYDAVVRALLVEDDATIAEFVARGLREAGFAVDHFADGEAGLIAALDQPYDTASVGLRPPKRDGLSPIEA